MLPLRREGSDVRMNDDPYHDLRLKARMLSDLFKYGCTDGGCKMRPRTGGMHTNGGCRCMESLAELSLEVAAEADRFTRGKPRPAMIGHIL
jgi:hypothetical protein